MKKALNLTILSGLGISQMDAIPMIARAGYDGCFWVADSQTALPEISLACRRQGLSLDFIHAPVSKVDTLWMEGPEGLSPMEDFTHWIHLCNQLESPRMVLHVWTKFAPITPNALGIDRFGALLDLAQKEGVCLAFENAEVDCFLAAVFQALGSHPAAYFCFDTGHELCYSDGRDQLALYGEHLLITHLNDNEGRTGPELTSADDCHMMPFDGKVDWENVARRLKKCQFSGPLTYELKMKNKPGRHTHDRYLSMTPEEILNLSYQKACRFEALMESL